MDALVSICIPNYNGEKYLRESLESALAQTYQNTEILLVDNQSTDEGTEIAAEYVRMDRRVRLVQNNTNIGPVPNFNRCVSLARGEWIKYLFHDDVLEPECVEKMVNASTPDASMVVCKRDFIIEECHEELRLKFMEMVTRYNMDTIFPETSLISPHMAANAFLNNPIMNFIGEPTAVMLKRNVFDRFGMFNPYLIQLSDLEYWMRVASNTGFIYVPEPLVKFRLHQGGTTAANNASRKLGIFIDRLICYHEIAFHPDYARFRLIAASQEPPINLQQVLASELKLVRKMSAEVSRDYSRADENLIEDLNKIMLLFPAFELVKKIPFSFTYDRCKWKLRQLMSPWEA